MNWIFPLAGKGKRTSLFGPFKPFVSIKKKKIIEWFLEGIKKKIYFPSNLYFITTKNFNRKFNFKSNIKKILNNQKIAGEISISLINKTPKGPALTVKSIISKLNESQPCIIINADQFIDFELPKIINPNKIYIPLHFNQHGSSSYVKLNKKGKIIQIKEKKLISFYASSGVYIFGSGKLLKKTFRQYKMNNSKETNMSDIINKYLKNNKKTAEPLNTLYKFDLGNPKNINYFLDLLYK